MIQTVSLKTWAGVLWYYWMMLIFVGQEMRGAAVPYQFVGCCTRNSEGQPSWHPLLQMDPASARDHWDPAIWTNPSAWPEQTDPGLLHHCSSDLRPGVDTVSAWLWCHRWWWCHCHTGSHDHSRDQAPAHCHYQHTPPPEEHWGQQTHSTSHTLLSCDHRSLHYHSWNSVILNPLYINDNLNAQHIEQMWGL